MRILHVSSARTFGGGERHFVDLTRGLKASGQEIYAALRPTCVWKDRLDFLPVEGLFEVSIRNSFGVLSAIRLADFIREKEIDIVHAHIARDYIPASIACMASKARFVLTRHVLVPLKPFNRFALKNLAMAIAVSDAVAVDLKRIFPPEKVTVIHNGIDANSVEDDDRERLRNEFRTFHGIDPHSPLVGTLGELRDLKGQTEFVLAAAEIVKKIPDCRFVIAGEDHSNDRKFTRELKRLAKVLRLEDRILWLDWLEDTRSFYSAIDLFVSASRSESFGLAILESMASGTAVVATETDGAKLLLGINGPFARIEDPLDLAEKIVFMLENEPFRRTSSKDAIDRAASRFQLSTMVDRTAELYDQVMNEAN